jgi:teichuronic acid biosynthesis glycosyltransferase TuaH
VLYVDPPVSRLAPRGDARLADSLERPQLRLIRPSLARLTPRVPPGKSHRGMSQLSDVLLRRQLRRAVRRLGASVDAVVSISESVFGACDERLSVYWARDDFLAGSDLLGLPAGRIRKAEQRIAKSADVIVVVSPHLAEKWGRMGRDSVLIPNGCDAESLANARELPDPDDVDLPRPIAGVIGTLSERIDFRLLEALASRGHSLVLIGARQKTFRMEHAERLLRLPNVRWLGPRPYRSLPAYLGAIDVGLVPYSDTSFNRASFPLKTLEYLAAGLPVVATDLPAVRWLDTEFITVATDADAFVAAVEHHLAQGSTHELVRHRQEFAARHDWSSRAEAFAAATGLRCAGTTSPTGKGP